MFPCLGMLDEVTAFSYCVPNSNLKFVCGI
jgi:hypothetical protein